MINCDCDHDDYVGPFFLSKECAADLTSSAKQKRFNDTALADLTAVTKRGFFVNHQFKRSGWKKFSDHYLCWCMRWGIPVISFHPHKSLAMLTFDLTFCDRMLTPIGHIELDEFIFGHTIQFNQRPIFGPVRFQIGQVRTEDIEEIGSTLAEYAMFRTVNRQHTKVA